MGTEMLNGILDELEEQEAVTEEPKEEEKGVEEKPVEESVAGKPSEEESKEVEEESEEGKVTLTTRELAEQRQREREMKRSLDAANEQIRLMNEKLEKAGLTTEEEKAQMEQMQTAMANRNYYLENILEVMRVNPKYEDVDDVVSQQNFDDMVEAMANVMIEKEGGELGDVVKKLETEIWSLRNPYRFMYNQIKKYHPAYKDKGSQVAGQGDTSKVKTGPSAEEVLKGQGKGVKQANVGKIPTSVHNVPGGDGDGAGAWTAAKIDSLSEDQLHLVPADVYDKYMRNELK